MLSFRSIWYTLSGLLIFIIAGQTLIGDKYEDLLFIPLIWLLLTWIPVAIISFRSQFQLVPLLKKFFIGYVLLLLFTVIFQEFFRSQFNIGAAYLLLRSLFILIPLEGLLLYMFLNQKQMEVLPSHTTVDTIPVSKRPVINQSPIWDAARLLELIAHNKIDKVFEELNRAQLSSADHSHLIQLSQKRQELERRRNADLLSEEDFLIQKSRLMESLIHFIQQSGSARASQD